MENAINKPKVIDKKISELKPHPDQERMFGDVSQEELLKLADDIDNQGLQHPIEITSKDVIIAGHQRVRAFKHLKRDTIPAIIRDDLERLGSKAIVNRFIEDNLLRRHLSPLGKIHCALRLMENEKGSSDLLRSAYYKNELKVKVSKMMHISPRTINRYLLVLKAPREIQTAFDRGEISLVDAGKMACLNPSQHQLLNKKLKANEPIKEVVKFFKEQQRRTLQKYETPGLRKILRAYSTVQPTIESELETFYPDTQKNLKCAVIELRDLLNRFIEKQ